MTNYIKQIIKKIENYFLKKQIKKQNDLADEVIGKLKPIVVDKVQKKKKEQKELMDKIIANFPKDLGIHNGSKFIPSTSKDDAQVYHTIMNKYGEEMAAKGVDLTLNLKFKCTL